MENSQRYIRIIIQKKLRINAGKRRKLGGRPKVLIPKADFIKIGGYFKREEDNVKKVKKFRSF